MKLETVAKVTTGIDPVEGLEDTTVSKIWFTSKPISRDFSFRVVQLQLWTDSEDENPPNQDRSKGSPTWFELVILPDEHSTEPKVKGDRELVWRSHHNQMDEDASRNYGAVFDRRAEILDDLEPGDVIGVRVCARGAGWKNITHQATLTARVSAEDLFSPLSWTLESVNRPVLPSNLGHGVFTFSPSVECHVEALDSTPQTKIWFTSPALDAKAIKRIQKVRLFTTSRHQGPVSSPEDGSWSWFDIVILEDAVSLTPRVKDGVRLVWASHENKVDSTSGDYEGYSGDAFERGHDLLNYLEPGNVIGIQVCAQFAGWRNHAKAARLIIQISNAEEVAEPTTLNDAAVIMENQARIQQVIDETYSEISALDEKVALFTSPTMLAGSLRADDLSDAIKQHDARPLRLLALDGGGIRGVSGVRILRAIMKKISPNENLKPCEYFDLMVGTSTGGLLALMLGRLEMDLDECEKAYMKISKNVFNRGTIAKNFDLATKGAWYSSDTFQGELREAIKSKLGGDGNAKMFNQNGTCKVAVITTRADEAGLAIHLRTYTNPAAPREYGNWAIWEAARATSAAPFYFERMKVGDYEFIDGGVGFNNPTIELMKEVSGTFGPTRPVGCLVSIGTGFPKNIELPTAGIRPDKALEFFTKMTSVATSCERIHEAVEAIAPMWQVIEDKKYWRFNLSKRIADHPEEVGGIKTGDTLTFEPAALVDLDQWDKMDTLITLTDRYVASQEEAVSIKECADRLKALKV